MLKILFLENDTSSEGLVTDQFRKAGLTIEILRVDRLETFRDALMRGGVDLILSDHTREPCDPFEALRLANALRPEVPFIFLSGTRGEEQAIEALKNGASDYVLKERIERLVPATRRALAEAEEVRHGSRTAEKSRQRHLLLSEAERLSHTGAWQWNLTTDEWTFSDGWMAIHGLPNRKPGFAGFLSIVHPEDSESIVRAIERVRNGVTGFDLEHRIVRQDDGEVRFVRACGWFLRDAIGQVVQVFGFTQDVTERKRVEEDLRKTREEYRLLVENQTDMVARMTRDGRRLFVNASFLKLVGKTEAEVVNTDYAPEIHPDDVARVAELWTKTFEPPLYRSEIEARTRNADGEWRWCSWRNTAVREGPHEPTTAICVGRDITDLKLAEETWRESEERLRLAAEGVDMGIWDLDLRTNVATRTLRHDQIFGYKELQPVWTLDIALEHVLPEDRPIAIQAHAEAETTGKLFHEVRVRWPDGSIHWISARGRMYCDAQGRPLRIAGVVMDVTDRKRVEKEMLVSEERLRLALDAARMVAWEYDPATLQVHLSENAEAVLKLPRRHENSTQGYGLIHPDDVERHRALVNEAIATGGRYVSEYRHDHGDLVIWLEEQGRAVIDSAGKTVRLVGVVQNITERKRAEEELRRLNDELEIRVEERTAELAAANREMEAFAFTVSHDLRAPLRHVAGFAEILREHLGASLDEEGQECLDTIVASAERMGHLIDDLLKLSRLGRTAMNSTKVDLRCLVDEAIAELAPSMSGRSIDWHIGRLPCVFADRTLLRNVVVNLLSNAIKYTRKRDRAFIEIGSEKRDDEVVCFVRDNGAGFDMQFADKLFGVFQRLHAADEFEGTGIGLASVQRIIQRHAGRVWAEGRLGQGATFYFALPRRTGT